MAQSVRDEGGVEREVEGERKTAPQAHTQKHADKYRSMAITYRHVDVKEHRSRGREVERSRGREVERERVCVCACVCCANATSRLFFCFFFLFFFLVSSFSLSRSFC